jgi:protease I
MSHHFHKLEGKRIAILVTEGFEQVEMTEPRKFLDEAGADTTLIAPTRKRIKAWKETEWGDSFQVDLALVAARADDFHALVLPGGVINADKLRLEEPAIRFVKDFFLEAKPVAAICHGPWILIDAGVVKGRTLTSYPSIKSDLANAGAKWMDREVVIDNGLVTSRKPADIPAFNDGMLQVFGRDHYEMQRPAEAFRPVQAAR